MCIFLACKGVGAITLSFHGIVSKPVLWIYSEGRMSIPCSGSSHIAWLPALPLSLTAYNLGTSSPLHVTSPLKSSSTVPSPQPAPAIAWQCSSGTEPNRFASVKILTVALLQVSKSWMTCDTGFPSFSSIHTLIPCSFQKPGEGSWRQTKDPMLWGDLTLHPAFNHSLLLFLTYFLSPQCLNCVCIYIFFSLHLFTPLPYFEMTSA